MATLFLLCGLPGAGKTTLAKRIEQERHALRLCPDEWITQILADVSDRDERDRLRAPIEAIQWQVAMKTLALGIDVILEWGFWSQEERRSYQEQAEALGAVVKTLFLEVEREELWRRLVQRNSHLPPGTFAVTREEFDLGWSLYEPATVEELAANDLSGDFTMPHSLADTLGKFGGEAWEEYRAILVKLRQQDAEEALSENHSE